MSPGDPEGAYSAWRNSVEIGFSDGCYVGTLDDWIWRAQKAEAEVERLKQLLPEQQDRNTRLSYIAYPARTPSGD
jgi:hypothetical protein